VPKVKKLYYLLAFPLQLCTVKKEIDTN